MWTTEWQMYEVVHSRETVMMGEAGRLEVTEIRRNVWDSMGLYSEEAGCGSELYFHTVNFW